MEIIYVDAFNRTPKSALIHSWCRVLPTYRTWKTMASDTPHIFVNPPQQMMTFAAVASTTPTSTKSLSANKRPNKKQRVPLVYQ